jgi:protein arginine kinase activator
MTERPLECTECKRSITVFYTEIVGSGVARSCMCADCPILQKQLHGVNALNLLHDTSDASTGLCCGHCGTTLESIRMGHPLGCSECYEVFGSVLLQEMITAGKLPSRISASTKKSTPLHQGRSPGEAAEMNPSMRLLALNEALNETLSREDYEQAAWLRDQIKELMEKDDSKK